MKAPLAAAQAAGGGPARTPGGWQMLNDAGLLGAHVNIVHGHALDDVQLRRFCDLGLSFSAAAESEMSQGHGHPLTGRLRTFGRAPSLGVDLESVLSGDMLTQARIALGIQRSLDNVAQRETTGAIPPTTTIPVIEALRWVTLEGARMLRQSHRIGSLAPGKQADLVLIRADTLNMQPVHDPVASVVFQASLANIDSVMVAGRWRKRSGRLLDVDLAPLLHELDASGRRIAAALGLQH
ncbi:MAG: amidohydrolase family protein [Rubrivivax sp.]|jgi:cytosine/adenosine deaminase-related metal-dependent hydrolase|nr:amidohydrolase family protein [Rubrivivax sp.]MBK7264470.1 amidohydrolase family protein [Rubrivivax sp.]